MVGTTAWGLPVYVHPALDPGPWAEIAANLRPPSFAVINVDSGPGTPDDEYYPSVVRHLSQVDLVGYVDLAYGRRSGSLVRADVKSWRDLYGVDSIMLDRVPSGAIWAAMVQGLTDALRADSVRRLLANPGTVPDPLIARLFDVIATFEGPFESYVAETGHDRLGQGDRAREWHLVYDCPVDRHEDAFALAEERGVGSVYVTERGMPNPYDAIPPLLRRAWTLPPG